MLNTLKELDSELKQKASRLYFQQGLPEVVLKHILSKNNIDAVFFNRDYTPFSKSRDEKIAEICNSLKVPVNIYADALLNEPEQIHKDDGLPYTVFTPFMKKARKKEIALPQKNKLDNYFNQELISEFNFENIHSLLPQKNSQIRLKGGRTEGISLLKNIKELINYNDERNIPSIKGTSMLSAHHKFGTVSIRESYWNISSNLGSDHTLINELFWRDFFTHITHHFPRVLGQSFKEKYDNIQWENDREKFKAWCEGKTGFPIVDAGMRELVTTGFMHNRVRMIVASFLTKDLHIDWRWGERFFANHLTDYDPAVNNGNWQWAASTGCDAQPYFRIFNPWSQQQKFDPKCIYIKKWVPELIGLSPNEIHNLYLNKQKLPTYPAPIVNHKVQAEKIKEEFRNSN